MTARRKEWASTGRKLGHPPEGGETSILVTRWTMSRNKNPGLFLTSHEKQNKTKQNFTHWKKSLTHKGIGSSPAIVLLPRSKKQMWIWTEETDNWINLSQKSAIHLLSKECRSLTPVSRFHSETQTSAVYQNCLLDVTCPLTRPVTVFHTAASPSKQLLSPQVKWSISPQ